MINAKTIISPISGGIATLCSEIITLEYKGINCSATRWYYHCEDSGDDFSSPEQIDSTMLEIREDYFKNK